MSITPILLRLFTWTLALLLAVYTAVAYAPALVGTVALGTCLLAAATSVARLARRQPVAGTGAVARSAYDGAFRIFLIVFSASATIQTIVARDLDPAEATIDLTVGYTLVAYLVHACVTVAAVWLPRPRSQVLGLAVAMVYTSIFYAPAFATPEAAPPFVSLAALAMVLFASALASPTARRLNLSRPRLLLLGIVGLFALAGVYFSLAPHDSLAWLVKLFVLALLVVATILSVATEAEWQALLLPVVFLGFVIPTALSLVKLAAVAAELGFWPAVHYRLGLIELGKANLIARSITTAAPPLAALAITASRRRRRVLIGCLAGLALPVLVAAQSWSGLLAIGAALLFVLAVRYAPAWLARWRTARSSPWWYLPQALILAAVAGALLLLAAQAPRARVTSFNGRLLRYRATLDALADRPMWGAGGGNYYVMSRYYHSSDWVVDTQTTVDDPLLTVIHLARAAGFHTHNVWLEFAFATGLPAAIVFTLFLVLLFRHGWRAAARQRGQARILLYGCLAGIAATLGWGLIDVMAVSPPFLTFPTWALAGLVLAAPRSEALPVPADPLARGRLASVGWRAGAALLLILAPVAVAAPLAANYAYRAAFAAYQSRRWDAAAAQLTRASRWEPLNAKYPELGAGAFVNLSLYDDAIQVYERALDLKHGFAPYHAQLGWLYWLQGNLETATAHFEQAVEADPLEAWRDGLHADLALAYLALGRVDQALPLLTETIKLNPEMAQAPYWVIVRDQDGRLTVGLDPAYTAGLTPELEKRILGHLGQADHTARILAPEVPGTSPILLDQVLDNIEADYQAALAAGRRDAPGLLAAVAQAAHLAGLTDRAERAYLAFQQAFPASSYGFRGLGTLYREEGHFSQAQAMLQRAVAVSSNDFRAWQGLAEAYIAQAMWDQADAALDEVYRLEPVKAHLYELRAGVYRGRGEPERAAEALRQALAIQDSLPTRLTLAEIYRQSGRPQEAAEQCRRATAMLRDTWVRPLAAELWDVGTCLAQAPGDEVPAGVAALVRSQPVAGNVLLGHLYRARDELEAALAAYQAAVDARPDQGDTHYFLGETYQAVGRADPAEAEYRRAAELNPLESLPLLALGRMQWAQGRRDEALDTFRAAVDATPGWGEAQVELGNALLALGDQEGAATHYRQARLADHGVSLRTVLDLGAELASADVESPGPDYVRNAYATIEGQRQRVLFMHPHSRARYALDVPAGAELTFDVATLPDSWDQAGDGVSFAVYVESGGRSEQLFATYIDPKQRAVDRRWRPCLVDLGAYAGQRVTLILETDSGPAGDASYDWAVWGAPAVQLVSSN